LKLNSLTGYRITIKDMNNIDNVKSLRIAFTFAVIMATCQTTSGQADGSTSQEAIAISARPWPDSINLRWAPLDFKIWKVANSVGYRVERFTVSRNGLLLPAPQKLVVGEALRPLPESGWIELVKGNKYAAIAAQALFGERFEVDLRQSDVFTIVNKVRENEQRFSFALFSADMAPPVARASGLWLTDKNIKKGERYLYRIILNTADSVRGSMFVGPDDPYALSKPANLHADFKDKFVSLKWDKTEATQYTAYVLERSEDGKIFKRISESPLVTVAPTATSDTRYEYAIDSLADLTTIYHYRVCGLSPFGEIGPPSEVVSGSGIPVVEQVPFISSAISPDNIFIDIHWDFPAHNNNAIEGFEVRRAAAANGNYAALTNGLLSSKTRSFVDSSPMQSNYYKVLALGLDGEWYPSHVYYAQLIDSIPPLPPTGLKAQVSDDGKVQLMWNANTESDIYGYRIYKAYHHSEELAQITSEPLKETAFHDIVDLSTLNEHLYYRVMSVDKNQNHSPLSEYLRVALPDKVRPLPPVIVSQTSDDSVIYISWRRPASTDIVKYKVYRNIQGTKQWLETKTVTAGNDSVYMYRDTRARPGQKYLFTIISIDEAGLESIPSRAVSGSIPLSSLRPPVTWKNARLNREENKLTLTWEYPETNVQYFKLYRSHDGNPIVMYQTISGNEKKFDDAIVPGKRYKYRLMALFANGQRSSLSEEMIFTY
jgi:uncharacterized protein